MNTKWFCNENHRQIYQVIESQTIWGDTSCCAWLSGCDSVFLIPSARIKLRENSVIGSPNNIAFSILRRTIKRIGLPQVRNYRLKLLAQEEKSFQEQLEQKAHVYPEMAPLLVVRVEGGSNE